MMKSPIKKPNGDLREIDRKLIAACENLNSQAVYQFIKDGADVNAAHGAPIFAVTFNCLLDNNSEIKEVDPRVYGIIKLLLDSGAEPDGDNPNDSPLCQFVYLSYEICELLISKGANVNFCVEDEERTPLDMVLEEIMAYGDDTRKGIKHGYAKTLHLLEKRHAVTFEELIEKREKAKQKAAMWQKKAQKYKGNL